MKTQDARIWLRESYHQHGKVFKDDEALSTLQHLLKRRVMRFRRHKISQNPLHYLHDHSEFGDFCGIDTQGNPTLYPKACILHPFNNLIYR